MTGLSRIEEMDLKNYSAIAPGHGYSNESLEGWPKTAFQPSTLLLPTLPPTPSSQVNGANPKESIGAAKIPLHLWSPLATAYGSLGLLNGGKYGYGNYKATPVLASIYISAIDRHFSAWKEGQECDPVDDVPHLAAVLANIAILLESRAVGTMIDDRQMTGGYLKEIEKLTEIANSVLKLHSHLKPKHYTIKDSVKM